MDNKYNIKESREFFILYINKQREAIDDMKRLYPSTDSYNKLENIIESYKNYIPNDSLEVKKIKNGITKLWNIIIKKYTGIDIRNHIDFWRNRTIKYSSKEKTEYSITCPYFYMVKNYVEKDKLDIIQPNELENIIQKITMLKYECILCLPNS